MVEEEEETQDLPLEGDSNFAKGFDKAILGMFELIALDLGLPSGEKLYRHEPLTPSDWFYFSIALVFAALGPSWPIVRKTFPHSRLVVSMSRAAGDARVWITILLASFLVSMAPELYQRATSQSVSSFPVDQIADAVLEKLRPALAQTRAANEPVFPTADQIADSVARGLLPKLNSGEMTSNDSMLRSQLDAANGRISNLTQQLQATQTETKSGGLGLDDAQFWKLLRKFREGARDGDTCWIYVSYPATDTPSYKKTMDVWADINAILYYSNWKLSQLNNRTFFPPGISIYVNSDSGPAFNCANRLADLLRSFNIEAPVHINTSTPSLAACGNQCADVALGQISGH